ncbi:MAG: Exonuclease-like protein [Actinobacteria bacterium 66_15]|nr:MAG: Exonuclease-like protein [Actinobacteria bacterium 66_15]
MIEFVAIDVETANADLASICQIGVAHFVDGGLAGEWATLVDPQDYFDPMNISIHGIDEDVVVGAPVLPDVAVELSSWLAGRTTVSHTHFDRVSIHQALAVYELAAPACVWLDSARVARRTWPECARKGYGLAPVCEMLGYEFRHHDALEDAKAAGHILLAAMEATGLSLDDWLLRVERPINPHAASHKSVAREGNPDGPLFGEVMVFTGALRMVRQDAAAIAAAIGCRVDDNVTKRTTLLVVGDQDVKKLAGHDRSSKHRKAEALAAAGQPIRILRETDFQRTVAMASEGGS